MRVIVATIPYNSSCSGRREKVISYTTVHSSQPVRALSYTAGYFREYLDNKPAFHNLSIIYRIIPLPYNL